MGGLHDEPSLPAASSLPPSSSPHGQSGFKNKRRMFAAGILVAATLVVLAAFLNDSGSDSEIVVGRTVRTIQLDVMNGVGEPKLAQRVTDYLRSRGFDVVEIGNSREELERTLVIDRVGNPQAAVQVAEALGVPLEQVVQRIDKTLYLDVSVWIGKDYRSLDPFQ